MQRTDLSKISWHEWHVRKRTPLLLYFFYHGPTAVHAQGFPEVITINGSIVDHIVTSKDQLERFRKKLWNHFLIHRSFLLQTMEHAYSNHQKNLVFLRTFLQRDFLSESQGSLAQAYTDYVTLCHAYGAYVYLPLAIEPLLDLEVQDVLKQRFSDFSSLYDTVMAPLKESDVLKERRSLLKLALLYRSQGDSSQFKDALLVHSESFSFLKSKGMFMEFYDPAYYLAQLHRLHDCESELCDLELEQKNREIAFHKLLDAFHDDIYATTLFHTTNEAIFFRTWRTDQLTHTSYYVVSLFQAIALKLHLLDYHDVLYLLPDEVLSLLKHCRTADPSLIEQRKKAYIYITNGPHDALVLQGDDALACSNNLSLHESEKEIHVLNGTPAYRGIVQGRVVVLTSSDYTRIIPGCVLVVHTTNPEMAPYLKGVSAIVTEEGGILSHPAVISRELKIPSVIGTKVATTFLKDGDLVLVNADKGEVRKV